MFYRYNIRIMLNSKPFANRIKNKTHLIEQSTVIPYFLFQGLTPTDPD